MMRQTFSTNRKFLQSIFDVFSNYLLFSHFIDKHLALNCPFFKKTTPKLKKIINKRTKDSLKILQNQ